MTRITAYRAGAWHEFHGYENGWLGTQPAVVIIPEQEYKGNVTRAFPCLNTDSIFSIPELIAGYVRSRGVKGLVSSHVTEAILSSIITENFIPYLKIENFRHNYIRALAAFISNFRNSSLANLETALAAIKGDSLSFKEKDLINIYSEYEKRLPEYGFDLRSGLIEFLDCANEDNIHTHLGIRSNEGVIFLGFNSLNPLEEEFIFTLLKYVHRASFLFCADSAASKQAMHIQESITALLKRLQYLGMEHKTLPLQQDTFTDLSRNIFKSGAKVDSNTEIAKLHGKIFIKQANSRFQEIVSIARQIKHLVETGTAPNEIRVAAPAYTLYSSIIAEVFPEYDIPFTPEQGVPLLQFPLAVVILHLVNQSISSNPYSLREKILSSPYTSYCEEISPQDLTAFQKNCGVELLTQEKLHRYIATKDYQLDFNYLNNIRRKAYQTVKPASGTPQLEVVNRYLNECEWKTAAEKEQCLSQCLVQFYLLARVEKILSGFKAKMNSQEFIDTLQGIMERLHIPSNIDLLGTASTALKIKARNRAVFARVHLLLEEVVSSLATKGRTVTEKHNLAELVRIFSYLMSQASLFREEYAPSEDRGVVIQPVNRGQYEKWGYTFICGLVDGEFPASDTFNFLQPKNEGLSLGQSYTSVDYGRNHFYYLIRSTTKALFFSHPLSDIGKRLPSSPFIREIENLLAMEPSDNSTPETAACRDKLYTRREKLLFIGTNADKDYDSVRPLLQEMKAADESFSQNITEILRFDGLTMNARLSEFDGILSQERPSLSSSGSSLALLRKKIRSITFTPGVLERYASCPLRFFFDNIMGLKQVPDYDPDTTETGLLLRSLLNEYTAKACGNKAMPDDAPLLFLRAIERHLEEQEQAGGADAFQFRFFKGLTSGLDKQKAERKGLLAAFLEYEENGPDFLSPYLPQMSGTVKLGDDLEIQVEIDRVDLAGDTEYLLPFFYTNAGTGNPNKIRRGLRFDLPLAVLLCENFIAKKDLYLSVAGAGLYQVKTAKTIKRSGYFAIDDIRAKRQTHTSPERPIFSGQREGFLEREVFNHALEKCIEQIMLLYRLMHKGVFHLPLCLAAEQSCDNCTFGRLCRKEQLRLERLKSNITDGMLNDEQVHLVRDIF